MADADPPARTPIPGWAWIFILACVMIPVLTMGGAVPGMIGGGGVGGCIALSKNQSIRPQNRVLGCLATTLAAWLIAIVVLDVIAKMNMPGR